MIAKSSPDKVSFTISTRFLKNRILLISLGVVIVLGGGFYWFIGTPQYSMWQLKQAAIHQDADKTMQFINVDKLMDNIWPKFTSAMMAEATKTEDPFGMLGAMLGSGLIENMKPTLKEQLITGIRDNITGKSNSDNSEENSSFIVAKEDLNKLKLKTS